MCHVLFIPFLGRSASRLFCVSEEEITQKSWVETIHSWKQIASKLQLWVGSNVPLSLEVKPQQKSQASLLLLSAREGLCWCELSRVPDADALPVPSAELQHGNVEGLNASHWLTDWLTEKYPAGEEHYIFLTNLVTLHVQHIV